jgi:hypothetical protein
MAYFITADCPARMPKSSQYMSRVNIVKISPGICRKDGEKDCDSAMLRAMAVARLREFSLAGANIPCEKSARRGAFKT